MRADLSEIELFIANAWSDHALKAALISNPAAILKAEGIIAPVGVALPGNSAATFAHVLSSTTKSSRFTLIKTQPTRSLNHSLSRNASDNIERGSGARGGPAQHHAGTEGTIIAPAREGQEIRRRQGAGRIGRDLPTIRRRGCVSCCRGTGRTARLSRQPLPD